MIQDIELCLRFSDIGKGVEESDDVLLVGTAEKNSLLLCFTT